MMIEKGLTGNSTEVISHLHYMDLALGRVKKKKRLDR